MADMIDRQAAIEIVDFECGEWRGLAKTIEKRLSGLSSVQLSFSQGQENDLISRQAAIDALGERPMVWVDSDDYALGERNQYDSDKLAIETVPSAQPERKTGRCRDCKHYDPYDSGKAFYCLEGINGCYPDDFYSYGERREDG